MNVLILNLTFYPKIGGVENSIRALCEIYSQRGDNVTVVSSDIVDESKIKYPNDDFMFGANIRRFSMNHPFTYLYSLYILLKKLKKESSFDLVISRSHITTYVAGLVGFDQVNYVVPGVVKYQYDKKLSSLNKFIGYFKIKINEYIQKKSFYKAFNNYVFSELMVNQVKSISPNSKVIKTHPGCDQNRFYPSVENKVYLRKKYNFSQNDIILLCVGRLQKAKGFNYAINSLNNLPKQFVLIIVGDGPEYSNLVQEALSHNLQDRVFFMNKSNNPEIFYRMADALLFTSIYEPFGQVLLEATFTELKVFAFDPEVNTEINTATKEIYFDMYTLVQFVPTPEDLPFYIKKEINNVRHSDDELLHFRSKYNWNTLVKALDYSK